MSTRKLPTTGYVSLVSKFAEDFSELVDYEGQIPFKLKYTVQCPDESGSVVRSARKAELTKMAAQSAPLRKFAFDTRRIDQEMERNPRANCQYWHRSEEFITEEQQAKINTFGKLLSVLEDVKKVYGKVPEWHDSYARILYDKIVNTLRIKQGDSDIFGPQLAYLEQLMFARYRLTLEQIDKEGVDDLKKALLAKDEDLVKRGIFFLNESSVFKDGNSNPVLTQTAAPQSIVIDGSKLQSTQESIVNAIFGKDNVVRKEGEKTVERTITITIRDEVVE